MIAMPYLTDHVLKWKFLVPSQGSVTLSLRNHGYVGKIKP